MQYILYYNDGISISQHTVITNHWFDDDHNCHNQTSIADAVTPQEAKKPVHDQKWTAGEL